MEEWQTEAVRLFGEGVSYRAIAEQVGQSRKRVTYHLKKLGYHHQVNPNILTANRRTGENKRRPLYACQHCGKEYRAKAHDRDKYCGRPCYFAAKTARATVERPIREAKRIAEAEAKRLEREATRRPCEICGESFIPHFVSMSRLCGKRECELEDKRRRSNEWLAQRHVPLIFQCKECGIEKATTYGDKSRTFCSPRCSLRYARRIARSQRRAKIRGNGYESINPLEVFAAYRWRCAMCGVGTPRKLRGTLAPQAPELDHIISLADKGTHTRGNVQLLCRRCNQEKSGRSVGQPVMIW